jgi:hypothetical protein
MSPNYGWHTGDLDDLMEMHRGLRAPSAGKSVDQGNEMGLLQDPWVWGGRSCQQMWWCWGRATVAPATMATAEAVAWASDMV